MTDELTHFDEAGQAHMVDVGAKAVTHRRAVAEGWITMEAATLAKIEAGDHKKGDVLGIARLAAIMGAKRTSELIPLCHPLMLSHISVDFTTEKSGDHGSSVRVEACVECTERTGVEMEALTAVQVALLTVYDMCKAIDRGMTIGDVRLVHKSGGKSGEFNR